MQSNTDWPSIRQEYEQGASKQALSQKHGITRQAIIKRARKEFWITHLVTSPVTPPVTHVTIPFELSDTNLSELSDQSTVDKAILLITERLDEKPENKDIKMLMDSLSQAYKIKALVPADQNYAAYDIRELLAACTPEELAIVNPVIKEVAARKAEQDDKIRPLKKFG